MKNNYKPAILLGVIVTLTVILVGTILNYFGNFIRSISVPLPIILLALVAAYFMHLLLKDDKRGDKK